MQTGDKLEQAAYDGHEAERDAQEIERRRQWHERFLAQNLKADQEHDFDPEAHLGRHEFLEINIAMGQESEAYMDQVAWVIVMEEDQQRTNSPVQSQQGRPKSPTRPRKRRRPGSPRRSRMRPRRRRSLSSRRRRTTGIKGVRYGMKENTLRSSKHKHEGRGLAR